MQQLIETVLPICSRLSEVDHSSFIWEEFPSKIDTFSITFHIQLLDMGNKLAQSLAVRKDSPGAILLNCGPIEPDQP